jgi:hypothetical protein
MFEHVEHADDVNFAQVGGMQRVAREHATGGALAGEGHCFGEQIHADDLPAVANLDELAQHDTGAATDFEHAIAWSQPGDDAAGRRREDRLRAQNQKWRSSTAAIFAKNCGS